MTKRNISAYRAHRRALEKLDLTSEEKARWASMLQRTWGAIANDVDFCGQRVTRPMIIEMVCDANRPMMHGGMTQEEYDFLEVVWSRPSSKRWLGQTLNY